jgi:hypothetical protein
MGSIAAFLLAVAGHWVASMSGISAAETGGAYRLRIGPSAPDLRMSAVEVKLVE